MPTIVKLTGTSGSGKSTIAHWLLRNYPNVPLAKVPTTRKVARDEDFAVSLPDGKVVIILGSYSSQCGGCDAIQPFDRIPPKLAEYTELFPKHHIFMEGLLVSGHGTVGEQLDKLNKKKWNVVYAYMDTPLETCLERIQQRRALKGKTEPLNPKNTTEKHRITQRLEQRAREELGINTAWIDHKRPVKSLLALYGIELSREPRHG